jgi:deoxyribodipyrimidine photo-lyase
MKQDWRYGAQYFEEKLIDHDVHSNYCSWAAASGIGPRKPYVFDLQKQ